MIDSRSVIRLVRPSLTALPGSAGAGVPRARQVVRKLRIARTQWGPMRVVYEHAIVHEKFSLRARVVQRSARVFFKPLMYWMPLSDRSIRAIRTADRHSARGPRSRYVEPVRFDLGGVPVESMTQAAATVADVVQELLGPLRSELEQTRTEVSTLRLENEALRIEVHSLREALKTKGCPALHPGGVCPLSNGRQS